MEDTLFNEIIEGLEFSEKDLNHPTFTWNNNSYPCVPSISLFERQLESGGFVMDELLTMSVRLFNSGYYTFPNNVTPQPQQIISYQSKNYRIQSIKPHPTGAYMRIIAHCTTAGF